MKAIPLQHIPTFHGLTSEDLDAFLFEFDVLCRGYDYTTDPQKLKLFPSTLKGATLRWLMGLGGGVINNLEQMKESFLKKYQDYYRSRELKDEIFQMIARPNKTLEEYVERFQYNLQRSPYASLALPDNVLKTTLIRGMKEQWIETLNIMGKGDIYQESFADIIGLCIRSLRGSTRIKPTEHDRFARENKISSEVVTRMEIGNLFENFKTDILGTLTTQLDVLQAKQKQMEAEQNLATFCPRCRKKHSHKECPLDTVQICAISTRDHSTESCPSLPGLKAVYKEAEEEPEVVYLLNQHRQWQPRQTGMFSDPTSSFQYLQYNTQQYNTWQSQFQPPFPNWSSQSYPSANPWLNQTSQSAQPNPNPNNRPVQALQILETPEEGPDLRECNDLQLRSGRIIQTEGSKTIQIEDQLPREHLSQEEDVNRQQTQNQATTSSPPFPERLVIPRPIQQRNFDILGELQNLYIKIPFLQAIQDIPIYAKTIKELCIKRPRRNTINNPRVQVVGTLSDLLSGKETPIKYEDPGNHIVTIQIYGQTLTNALVDLGAAINILTTATCQKLGITSAESTSTLLELADRSVVRPKGILHDVMVSVDSWEYPIDFLIINPKTRLDGHPLILGRPWLTTVDAYIGCWQGNMIITKGADIKNLVLYPPAQPSIIIVKTNWHLISYLTDNIRSPLTIQEALEFKDQTEDDAINNFISQTELTSRTQCHMIKAAFDNEVEGEPLKDVHDHAIPVNSVAHSKIVEIEPGKTLNINADLTSEQETKIIHILRKYKESFAWDYPDMKGIDPQLCTHHIYIENDARPVRQPQRRLNPHLKEVVKAELQKLLDVNFIYPISDSKWVSPLVVVPKKNGKWRICVDYRELNKAT
eukprot:PITA_28979